MPLPRSFTRVDYADLPGWLDDDLSGAFAAFRRSALHVLTRLYKTGSLGVDFGAFDLAYEEARRREALDAGASRAFFERHFAPAMVRTIMDVGVMDVGGSGSRPSPGLVTGYYEPEVEASLTRTARHTVPMHARPSDLIDIDDDNRPAGMDPYLAFARRTGAGLVEYHDRVAIDGGALEGQGLEMFWFADKVDLFFVQVQGAARLRLTDGSVRRVHYAAKSGQRFTAIGRRLVDMGELRLEDVTMQSIRAWLKSHPERMDDLLHQNRSYIFFQESDIGDPQLGPLAAAKVQLTPGRSIAVDRLLHTFGTPFYIDAPELTAFDRRPFRRLMIAQDTGSAIVGPTRGDLFAGSGDGAGEIAGVVRADADFYVLLPRGLL